MDKISNKNPLIYSPHPLAYLPSWTYAWPYPLPKSCSRTRHAHHWKESGTRKPIPRKGPGTKHTHSLEGTWDHTYPPQVGTSTRYTYSLLDKQTPVQTLPSSNYCCGWNKTIASNENRAGTRHTHPRKGPGPDIPLLSLQTGTCENITFLQLPLFVDQLKISVL